MTRGSVLISGLGIAGPCLAYWLVRAGFSPTIVERERCPRSGGYAIDFWGTGYEVAERMGLARNIAREDYRVSELKFVDDRGQRTGGFDATVFRRLAGGRFASLRRGALASLLYRSIEAECEIIFDDTIIKITEASSAVDVDFRRTSSRSFDLVIGADGLHSVVRRLAFGGQGRFEKHLGYIAAAFAVQGYRPRDEGAYVAYSTPGKQIARLSVANDTTIIFAVFVANGLDTGDLSDPMTQRQILHHQFNDEGWECSRMLDLLDQGEDLYFDRVSQIRMDRWSSGRIALIGDAAYAPSLLTGQGAALAMTGAYVLARELDVFGRQYEAAFSRYEDCVRPLVVSKQRAGERLAGAFAPRTRFGIVLRNQVSKVLSMPWFADLVLGSVFHDRLGFPGLYSPSRQ